MFVYKKINYNVFLNTVLFKNENEIRGQIYGKMQTKQKCNILNELPKIVFVL